MEIEVGEYIRTDKGIISKCIEEKVDRYIFDKIVLEEGYYNDYILKDIPERANFITKHSKNIIDLIEEGDYVNGCEVIKYLDGDLVLKAGIFSILRKTIIKSIVTKEQFKNVEYIV